MGTTVDADDPPGPGRPAADPHRAPAGTPRWAWTLLAASGGVNVGGVTGVLVHADGGSVPGAVVSGGGAFAATVLLVLTVVVFNGGQRAG